MGNKKILFYGTISVVTILTISFLLAGKNKSSLNETKGACADICSKAKSACASLIDEDNCNSKCYNFSNETKEHLKNSNSCEELTQKPELIADVIMPEVNTPNTKAASNDCEAACNKYVMACLTLVPNVSEALFSDGFNSCLKDCTK